MCFRTSHTEISQGIILDTASDKSVYQLNICQFLHKKHFVSNH